MHHVYILYSPNFDKYYVGESANAEERLRWHNELSDSSYTKPYRPWKLVKVLTVRDYSTARKVENYIKRQKSKQYVKRIVNDELLAEWLINKFNNSVG